MDCTAVEPRLYSFFDGVPKLDDPRELPVARARELFALPHDFDLTTTAHWSWWLAGVGLGQPADGRLCGADGSRAPSWTCHSAGRCVMRAWTRRCRTVERGEQTVNSAALRSPPLRSPQGRGLFADGETRGAQVCRSLRGGPQSGTTRFVKGRCWIHIGLRSLCAGVMN
jgi:hypothetical protein